MTCTATGAVVANRYNFDLPDTGMLFPGDVLHYYFAATDDVAGDSPDVVRPARPHRLRQPGPLTYPTAFTVNCLPTILDAARARSPRLLFWNDAGIRGGEDEWYGALRELWASVRASTSTSSTPTADQLRRRQRPRRPRDGAQIDGYTDMLYSVRRPSVR